MWGLPVGSLTATSCGVLGLEPSIGSSGIGVGADIRVGGSGSRTGEIHININSLRNSCS